MSTSGSNPNAAKPKSAAAPVAPRPSATVIVINARNEVLLVQRNPNSSSFANAYVFPGGNYDEKQDGAQGLRLTAIRELFEESGLLLVHPAGALPSDAELDRAREAVHAQKLLFSDFLAQQGLRPNVEALLPFTQWITPPMYPKRFQTQFFVAFLDAPGEPGLASGGREARLPTPDGAREVVAARFVHPAHALAQFAARAITLFPPQYYLLRTLADVLAPPESGADVRTGAEAESGRERVRALAQGAFGRMVLNPRAVRDAAAEEAGWRILAYEGDEAHGGPRGRRHRSRVVFGPGGSASSIVLERNFDIFSEVEDLVPTGPAKL